MTMQPEWFHGGWRLVGWSVEYGPGRPPGAPFGTDAQGLLLYGADGWMTATMHERRRTVLSDPSARLASLESRGAAFAEYLTYGGRWRLDGTRVIHDIRFALNPVLVGTTQVRDAEFRDGALHLVARESTGSRERVHRIVWRRGDD